MDKKFIFVYGDEFLVELEAKKIYQSCLKESLSHFECQVIDGSVNNLGELQKLSDCLRAEVQTFSLFNEKKYIWLKNVNFLGDSVTAKAEGAKKIIENIQSTLSGCSSQNILIIISCLNVDKRTREFKWFNENGKSIQLDSPKDVYAFMTWAKGVATEYGVVFESEALEFLIQKINSHPRLLIEEMRKLSIYIDINKERVDVGMVKNLVPDFGQSDFFEPVEAFFSLDVSWALEAVRRYFFIHKEPRPLLSALQNKNRLLIQLKLLIDSNSLRIVNHNLSKADIAQAQTKYSAYFDDSSEKNSFNVFSQNPWYLSNLANKNLQSLSLKKLLHFQKEFLLYFKSILEAPAQIEHAFELMVIRCLN